MLILSRFEGEEIMIGDDITIKVTRCKGHLVTIGINAPKDTKVWRKEIWDRLQLEKAKL